MIKLENFSVSRYPVTKIQWDAVRLWAKDKGYTDLSTGRGKGRQPVGCVTWYDAVKFLNALSELSGLEPVYRVNGEVYRTGIADLEDFDKSANGYRLPMKEEWIYAASGGTNTKYLWGDEEYPGCFEYAWEFKEAKEVTKEVGLKKPNGYGLYDVIGNVYEWCFDKKYETLRVIMGGSVSLDSILATEHESVTSPEYRCYETGFRIFSNNKDALSVDDVAKLSGFYGQEEWPEAEYPDVSKTAIAKRLAEQLTDDELSCKLKLFIESGKLDEAFELFRDEKFKTIREKYKNEVEEMLGNPIKEDELLNIKDINDFVFFKGNFAYDVYHGFDEFELLAEKFRRTKDKKYLDGCILILKAFLIRHKAEFDVLTDEQLSERNNTPLTWAWGNGFDTSRRRVFIMHGLAKIEQALEDYNLFPADLFVDLAISLTSYGMYPSMKDGREKITNQIEHSASWTVSITSVFCEFKNSKLAERISLERWKNGMGSTIYPDGSACEQSLEYNYSLIEGFKNIEAKNSDGEKIKEVRNVLEDLNRMLISVKTPVLRNPVTAYSSWGIHLPKDKEKMKDYLELILTTANDYGQKNFDWIEWDRIKNVLNGLDDDAPRFNSIFFPYGGTAAIRDSWSRDSRYLYFFAPRAGAGHSAEAVGDVQIFAFGRELLSTGGTSSYRLEKKMSKEQIPMMNDLDNYISESNSRNTVLVDGKGQSRLKETEQVVMDKYPDTTGYRFHENDSLVYVEGRYSDGYYSCDDVTHKREILFLKEEGIWVIVDRLYSEKPHTYTQNWHMNVVGENFERKINDKLYSWEMDGFKREDIVSGDNEIYTKDESGANIFIRHFGDVEYKRYFGEKQPYLGWSSISTNKFRYYPVEEIHCNFKGEKNTVLVTVIEASENTKSKITNIIRKADGGSFELNLNKYSFTKNDNGRIELSKNNKKWIILDDMGKEFCEIKNWEREEFKAPIDFEWKELDGYYLPEYKY